MEPAELLAVGDRVVALGYEPGRGAATGVAFRARFAHLWTVEAGQVTRMEGIIDTAAIRDALTPGPGA